LIRRRRRGRRRKETNLDDLVSWEREEWNVSCIAGHEIAVEDTQDGLVSDNQEIILFAF